MVNLFKTFIKWYDRKKKSFTKVDIVLLIKNGDV